MRKMIESKKIHKQNTTILHINNSALSYNS